MEHCWINQNAKFSLGHFDQGERVKYEFNPVNKCLFIFIIEGTVQIGNDTLETRDALGIWETGAIEIDCTNASQFLVIETPINQK